MINLIKIQDRKILNVPYISHFPKKRTLFSIINCPPLPPHNWNNPVHYTETEKLITPSLSDTKAPARLNCSDPLLKSSPV